MLFSVWHCRNGFVSPTSVVLLEVFVTIYVTMAQSQAEPTAARAGGLEHEDFCSVLRRPGRVVCSFRIAFLQRKSRAILYVCV